MQAETIIVEHAATAALFPPPARINHAHTHTHKCTLTTRHHDSTCVCVCVHTCFCSCRGIVRSPPFGTMFATGVLPFLAFAATARLWTTCAESKLLREQLHQDRGHKDKVHPGLHRKNPTPPPPPPIIPLSALRPKDEITGGDSSRVEFLRPLLPTNMLLFTRVSPGR